MATFYGRTVKTPDDKFSTGIAPGRDEGTHEVSIKGYDTSVMTMTEAQVRSLQAALNAKFGASNEPF